MPKKTQQARLVEALEADGCKRIAHRSTRYVVLSSPQGLTNYYVGRSGALRRGQTVSESRPVHEILRKSLLDRVSP